VLALLLLVLLLPAAARRLRGRSRAALAPLALPPLVAVVALVVAAVLNARGWVLAVPVAINALLLRPSAPRCGAAACR
jgi:hypothetical protein